jgi:hemerythrin-like metal-binding protein
MVEPIYSISESLSIAYDDIDVEHGRLIALLNGMLVVTKDGQPQSARASKRRLDELSEAMTAHFDHEEREMASVAYSHLAQHKEHHLGCVAKFNAIRDSMTTIEKPILDQIFDLVIDDIIRADSGFKSFLYAKDLIR